MKILVTGVTGFVGRKVLNELCKKYNSNDIVALSSKNIDGIKTIIHNNYNFDENIFIDNGCEDIEILLHIGAFIPKIAVDANNILKCNSNIINTQKLLYTNLPNLRKIIFASTIDVYDEAKFNSEKTATNPISLYGWSKLYCEILIEKFSHKKKLTYQILRLGHIFGEGEEKYNKLLPLTINKVLKNENIEIWGDGNAIRTYIYIDDVAKSIVNSLKFENSNVINIVGSEKITIKELVNKIIHISKKNISIDYKATTIPNRNLIFDNTKFKELLLPETTSLDIGIKMEYDYMEKL